MNELKIIKLIKNKFSESLLSPQVLRGIGDDAAVVSPSSHAELLTTDMMIEGIHFDLSFARPFQIGFKLLARNVSDIFAMAGIPEFLLLNLSIPPRLGEGFIEELLDGLLEAAKKYRISLVGGDFSISPGPVFLSATLRGSSSRPVMRGGARPGDRLYVTGTLGDAACGLEILKRGAEIKKEVKEPLIKKALMPEPEPVNEKVKGIHAMIDISDGLSIDLWRLCEESNSGAVIFEEKIPFSEELLIASEILGLDPLNLALSGGEDYELLFAADHPVPLNGITEIGVITEERGIRITGKDGRERPLRPEGYIHKSEGNSS